MRGVSNRRKLAKVISVVFDPAILIPLIVAGVTWWAYVNGHRWQFFIVLMLIDAGGPGVVFVWRMHKNGWKDWDIHRREERLPLFKATLVFHAIGVVAALAAGQVLMGQILLALWLLAVLFAAVTTKWKISVHAGVNATLATLICMVGGWGYWWVWLIVIVVGWARVVDKDHSVEQVVWGSVLPPVVLVVVLGLMGVSG